MPAVIPYWLRKGDLKLTRQTFAKTIYFSTYNPGCGMMPGYTVPACKLILSYQ